MLVGLRVPPLALTCYDRPVRGCVVLCMAFILPALSGCPRYYGFDAGSGDAGTREDAGPIVNGFDGPIAFLPEAEMRDIDPSALRAGTAPCRAPLLGRVHFVFDGDTIDVRGENEVFDASVRMIGIDTPEIARDGNPAQCYGVEAQAFTRQLENRLVWLTFDNGCFDTFGRSLAYVHIGDGEGDFWQRQLLRRGFASLFTVSPNATYEPMFATDENEAARIGAGFWSACR